MLKHRKGSPPCAHRERAWNEKERRGIYPGVLRESQSTSPRCIRRYTCGWMPLVVTCKGRQSTSLYACSFIPHTLPTSAQRTFLFNVFGTVSSSIAPTMNAGSERVRSNSPTELCKKGPGSTRVAVVPSRTQLPNWRKARGEGCALVSLGGWATAVHPFWCAQACYARLTVHKWDPSSMISRIMAASSEPERSHALEAPRAICETLQRTQRRRSGKSANPDWPSVHFRLFSQLVSAIKRRISA